MVRSMQHLGYASHEFIIFLLLFSPSQTWTLLIFIPIYVITLTLGIHTFGDFSDELIFGYYFETMAYGVVCYIIFFILQSRSLRSFYKKEKLIRK